MAVAWREAKRYIQKPDLVIHVFSSLGTTRGSTGSTSAWVRLWFIVVILLLRCALLVSSAATNLPFPARLWWAEWSSTVGGATTLMAAAGGEDGTGAPPWLRRSSASVLDARAMTAMAK